MNISGFTAADYNVFKIDGLDPRMEALKNRIQPKLRQLGDYFSKELTELTGDEMFPHVAKHMRRTINPPNDTWVAISRNSRGYKMMPHFQIGLWGTHMFVWFSVIYEAPDKAQYGLTLENNAETIKDSIPGHFVWSIDHTKPDVIPHSSLSLDDMKSMFQRLQTVKKAEILCGIQISREDAVSLSDQSFIKRIQESFEVLIPLYKLY
ncbi:YktB family protein [Peribacillus sp. B-H-3]|uniref:YktB family protein n=1 Tax=Peribacillus sp. B-H-3 TaxID=3400420 RepID=UPI003B01CC09